MIAHALDTITQAFVGALAGAFHSLMFYGFPLLAVLAMLAFYLHAWPYLLAGAGQMGDALASFVLVVIKMGFFYWLLVRLPDLANASLHTFAQWGGVVGGSEVSLGMLTQPSLLMDLGFKTGKPLLDYLQRMTGWGTLFNFPTVMIILLAYWIIIASFAVVSLHMVMTILEFRLAVAVSAVLIPWGILSHTQHLCEFSFSWLVGSLIRVLLTLTMLSIGVPLFRGLVPTLTEGGDPTIYSSLVLALAALLFGILAWIVPARAASVGGRGMALAIGGDALLAAGGRVVGNVQRAGGLASQTVRSVGGQLGIGRSRPSVQGRVAGP